MKLEEVDGGLMLQSNECSMNECPLGEFLRRFLLLSRNYKIGITQ
jgi:hypothetical protein